MALPRVLADEIVNSYGDVLRVGRFRLNGQWVSWPTDGSTQRQLESFANALLPEIKSLPEVAIENFDENDAAELMFCMCKAVSINYVLYEVFNVLAHETGKHCSIDSRSRDDGPMAGYFADVKPGLKVSAGINWSRRDNVVSCMPEKRDLVGTLSRVQTDFCLLPDSQAAPPVCRLKVSLKRPLAEKVVSHICCKNREDWKEFSLKDPLWSGVLMPRASATASSMAGAVIDKAAFEQSSRPSGQVMPESVAGSTAESVTIPSRRSLSGSLRLWRMKRSEEAISLVRRLE